MPELPEVETYARDLAGVLPGRVLTGAWTDWPNQLPLNTPAGLDAGVRGQAVAAVGRRGKHLVVRLTRDWLIIHLKMSGRLQLVPAASPPNPHAHVVFGLDGGDALRFHDPRKFGRVYLVTDPAQITGALGPEPLAEDFTPQALAARLAGRRGRLKSLLLDQTFVAGVGNIYADEALHRAGLHPLRPADTLTPDEQVRLYIAIRAVLAQGIANRGTNLDWAYTQGTNQDALRVFHRHGQPCPTCGTLIERITLGQRGTHFCPMCQPAWEQRQGDARGG